MLKMYNLELIKQYPNIVTFSKEIKMWKAVSPPLILNKFSVFSSEFWVVNK